MGERTFTEADVLGWVAGSASGCLSAAGIWADRSRAEADAARLQEHFTEDCWRVCAVVPWTEEDNDG